MLFLYQKSGIIHISLYVLSALLSAKESQSQIIMQPMPGPNRLGLGMRPPLPSYGQGPSMSALAQQQQMHHQPFMPPPTAQKQTTLFVGSISGGITDAFLDALLSVENPIIFRFFQLLIVVLVRHVVRSNLLSASLHLRISLKVSVLLNSRNQMRHYALWCYCRA